MGYDDPDALKLIAEVQQVYVVRYGDVDVTPVDADEFAPPNGVFLIGYDADTPVACGGWRALDGSEPGLRETDAEMKRLYVVPSARGNGHARRMLTMLEHTAATAGRRRMVLTTGTEQPEAIALYRSVGYYDLTPFGPYRGDPRVVCLAKDLTNADSATNR